jgi:predicted ATPase
VLLRFRAANVLSFRGEMELSLLAGPGTEHARPADARVAGRDLFVLPLAVIYGANASGKTNVLTALHWMLHAVTGSVTQWSIHSGVPRPRFALDPGAREEASLFEVDVMIGSVRYVYGFEVSDNRVETEWLHAYPAGRRRRQVWFERDAADAEPYRFPSDWVKGNRQVLVDATRPNSLFLTVAAQFNHPQLRPVHSWFVDCLWLPAHHADPSARLAHTRAQLNDPGVRARIAELMRTADLGVLDVEVFNQDSGPQVRLLHRGKNGPVALDFDEQESLGTQAWFAFLGPMLSALDKGSVVLVDELDASLHPALVAEVLRLFRDPVANPSGAQLVCTVHDVSLLGSAHTDRPLTRDEVWIVEKRFTGESELYPLSDTRPRSGESFERGYLRGRYGGVPSLPVRGLAAELSRAMGRA